MVIFRTITEMLLAAGGVRIRPAVKAKIEEKKLFRRVGNLSYGNRSRCL